MLTDDSDFDLLVVGDVNADVILWGSDVIPEFGQIEKLVDRGAVTVGGSSAIAACGAARLGLRTAFVGTLGDDLLGSIVRVMMEERGVRFLGTVADDRNTGITVCLSPSVGTPRAILTVTGTLSALTAGAVSPDLIRCSRHIHVGSYFLQPALQDGLKTLLDVAHDAGVTTSLDPNGDPTGRWESELMELLPLWDIFFPNEAELLAITRCSEVEGASAMLARTGPSIVTKLGSSGASFQRGGLFLRGSPPQVSVMDTTGAGDSFDAGYLFGYISGWSPERCLALGIACGSLSTGGLGGVIGQPILEDALEVARSVVVETSKLPRGRPAGPSVGHAS